MQRTINAIVKQGKKSFGTTLPIPQYEPLSPFTQFNKGKWYIESSVRTQLEEAQLKREELKKVPEHLQNRGVTTEQWLEMVRESKKAIGNDIGKK